MKRLALLLALAAPAHAYQDATVLPDTPVVTMVIYACMGTDCRRLTEPAPGMNVWVCAETARRVARQWEEVTGGSVVRSACE